jgi:Tol biopolymer transport system component
MGLSTLWIASIDGGRSRRIYDGDAVQPAWSPSGARIAFWASYGTAQRDLFTIPATGGAPVAVLQDAPMDWSPAWAPDGRWLYFASDRGGTMSVWRIAIDESTGRTSGAPEPVTSVVGAAAELPSLSKDGTKLVFRSRRTIVNPVAVPFDSSTARVGTPVPLFERTAILNPRSVSPDGRWLALNNLGEPREDIFIARTDGSEVRRLTDDAAKDRSPVWSPDGQEIAFYSNRSGSQQVWTIRSDGSGLTQRTDAKEGGFMFPLWSSAGDQMVASLRPGTIAKGFLWNLRKGWASAVELKGLTTPEGWLRPLDWSRDGRRLAGVVQDAAANAIGVAWYDIAADRSVIISHDHLPTPTDVNWLPDSRRMIFVTADGELVVIDADTKRRDVLETSSWPFHIADQSLAVTPDGSTLYVGARGVESDIWMVER